MAYDAQEKKILQELLLAARARDKAQKALDAAQKDIQRIVAEAFAVGLSGPELATIAGVKKARIYQLRDGIR